MRFAFAFVMVLLGRAVCAQTAEQAYAEAHTRLLAHTREYSFHHDGSPEAIAATRDLWAAVAGIVINLRQRDPDISADAIDHQLCLLTAEPFPPEAIQQTPEQQCGLEDHPQHTVVAFGKDLLLVAPFSGEVGTVFLIGAREMQTVVWSIEAPGLQALDTKHLVSAWSPERSGDGCRDKGRDTKWYTCGPLYGSVGMLPADSAGHPRFYVTAGYAQEAGATIGKQTTLWVWDGRSAKLLWEGVYAYMIDSADKSDGLRGDVLTLYEKDEYRNFFSCGACEGRVVRQRLRITPTGVIDLGKEPAVPELDLVDHLFSNLARGVSNASLASPQVSAALGGFVRDVRVDSSKIAGKTYSESGTLGMMAEFRLIHTMSTTRLCLITDGAGQFDFVLASAAAPGPRILRVRHNSKGFACGK